MAISRFTSLKLGGSARLRAESASNKRKLRCVSLLIIIIIIMPVVVVLKSLARHFESYLLAAAAVVAAMTQLGIKLQPAAGKAALLL